MQHNLASKNRKAPTNDYWNLMPSLMNRQLQAQATMVDPQQII